MELSLSSLGVGLVLLIAASLACLLKHQLYVLGARPCPPLLSEPLWTCGGLGWVGTRRTSQVLRSWMGGRGEAGMKPA